MILITQFGTCEIAHYHGNREIMMMNLFNEIMVKKVFL